MNLDEAKENIQPLASGRNIQRLATALSAESHESVQAELLQERRAYEEAIQTYTGNDPLGPWYEYVLWVEQSYPKSGKQSALDDVIQKCLLTFDQDARYNQDPRLIKLYIKYIDSQPNPTEHFQTLYNSGIGTMVADLYICWAYFYDVSDNFEKAESVFRKGKDARAEPVEALDLAHRQFGFSMSQRLLHKDNYRQDFLSTMEERRNALTSLRTQRGGQRVGTIRTGAAIKSSVPGRVDQQQASTSGSSAFNSNAKIAVFVDDSSRESARAPDAVPKSVVQTIVDSSRKQENLREPGPWSKASTKKSTPLFGQSVFTSFPILEDMDLDRTVVPLDPIPMSAAENMSARPIHLPKNFVRQNDPPTPFPTSYFIAEPVSARSIPEYDKCLLFPTPTDSFSIEELVAYRWFQRRHIQNSFTKAQDVFWLDEFQTGIRLYPQWCDQCDKNEEWDTARYIVEDSIQPGKCQFAFDINAIYPPGTKEELTMEDLFFAKWKRGEMPSQQVVDAPEDPADDSMGMPMDDMMDETLPVVGRQSIFKRVVRKSVVPGGRKSIFPVSDDHDRPHAGKPKAIEIGSTSKHEEDIPAAPFTLEGKQMLFKSLGAKHESDAGASSSTDPYKPPPFPFEPKPLPKEPVQPQPTIEQPFLKRRVLFGCTTVAEPPIVPSSSSGLFTGGVIRKSVCAAIKRKNESPAKPEVPAKENCLEEIVEEPEKTPEKGFAIFEDSISEAAVFKAPNPIAPRRPFGVRPPPAQEEKESDPAATETDAFQANDTCSTMQFNFFVKSQSMSTPKVNRRPPANAVHDSSLTEGPVTGPTIHKIAHRVSSSEATAMPTEISPPQPRQLSTIMETTESLAQMSTSSSDRDSDSSSKTSSRPGIFPFKPNSQQYYEAENAIPCNLGQQSFNYRPAEIPTLYDLQHVDERAETTLVPPVEESLFLAVPPTPRNMTMPSMCPIPNLPDDTLAEMTPAVVTQPIAMNIYRDDTEQMPVIPQSAIVDQQKPIKVLSDRVDLKPITTSEPAVQDVRNPFTPTTSLDRTDFQLPPDMSIPSMSFSQDMATGPRPPAEYITPAPAVENPFAPKAKLERTVLHPMPNESIPSISLLDDITTTQQLPVVSFARPTPVVLAPGSAMKIQISAPVTVSRDDFGVTDVEPIMEKIHISEPPVAKSKSIDDDFLDLFTKSPERSTFAKPSGSSTKKGSSRIPVPASCGKNTSVANVPKSLFGDRSVHIKSETLDSSSRSHPAPASSSTKINFDIDIDEFMCEDPVQPGPSSSATAADPALLSKSVHVAKPPPVFKAHDYATWDELSDSPKLDSAYVPPVIDLNETRQVIESHLDDAYSNPFDEEIKAAFLEQCDFVEYLKNLEVCVMVKTLRPIVPKSQLDIGDRSFDVQALVGKGNYGHVFSSQCQATGNQYALKQERPANLWEYYICLEIESRISDVPNMLNAFMTVECALIGNNASLLVSPFGRYGTMIDVCNKVRLSTTKNIPEPVVMMLAIQILSVVDHLHACKIIHADIKPDNILLVRRLSYDHHEICVQLIDFGQAIDMKLYPDKQVFRSKLTTRNFVCTEMMDDKPWTYQTDLFCVAATIYTLLFGADMKVRKAPLGYSLVTSIPRYYCKWMWESIFNALINIKDCRTMPNLQSLRNMLLHEVSNEKERATKEAIVRFNNIINAK